MTDELTKALEAADRESLVAAVEWLHGDAECDRPICTESISGCMGCS